MAGKMPPAFLKKSDKGAKDAKAPKDAKKGGNPFAKKAVPFARGGKTGGKC